VISATILHEVEVELWEAVAYYEEQSAGLGLDFEAEIEGTIQMIRHFPERWPLRVDSTRRCLTHRFPYLVIYSYLKDHVWIVAFAHCKRRSGYWQDRLKAAEQTD